MRLSRAVHALIEREPRDVVAPLLRTLVEGWQLEAGLTVEETHARTPSAGDLRILCSRALEVKGRVHLATAALILLSVVFGGHYLHVCQDDAFISFRYAAHLADHASLGFNGPGYARAEGYSNFTWVLLVAAAYAAGVAPLVSSKIFGLRLRSPSRWLGTARLVDALLSGALSRMPFELSSRCCGSVRAAVSPCGACRDSSRRVFVAALVAWSSLFVVRLVSSADSEETSRLATKARNVLLGLLGISSTAPETSLFGVLSFAIVWVALRDSTRRRAALTRLALWFGVPVLLQLAFRIAYYGRVTANTYYAKVVGERLVQRGLGYLGAVRRSRRASGSSSRSSRWSSSRSRPGSVGMRSRRTSARSRSPSSSPPTGGTSSGSVGIGCADSASACTCCRLPSRSAPGPSPFFSRTARRARIRGLRATRCDGSCSR